MIDVSPHRVSSRNPTLCHVRAAGTAAGGPVSPAWTPWAAPLLVACIGLSAGVTSGCEALFDISELAGLLVFDTGAGLVPAVVMALGAAMLYLHQHANPAERTRKMSKVPTAPMAQQPGGPK